MTWRTYIATALLFILLSVALSVVAQDSARQPGSAGYLAFIAPGDQNADVVVADLVTGTVLNLSNNTTLSAHPTWSGDGEQLAYNNAFVGSDGSFTDIEIFVMDANGLNPRNLTNHPAFDVSPDWSPVAGEIVFQSNRDGGTDLYIIDTSTGETRRLTDDGQPKNRPDWSPDGRRVAYWQIEGDAVILKVIDVATGVVTTLVNSGQNLWPAWSPDGDLIAVHDATGQAQIYLVDVLTGERTQISDGTANDQRPEWSSDGSQIAFFSDRAGTLALFKMDADGNNVQLFSEDIGADLSAAWRPQAEPINFAENPNLSLSAVRVNPDSVDAADQAVLGEGIRRLYAPRQSFYEVPVQIRLEIQLDDPTIVPESDPPGELQDEGSVEVYRIMGAELEGQDLEDFTLLPGRNGYLLQIQEDDVNYWDWRLIPNGPDVVGRKFLLVNIYLPDIDPDDGVDTKEILESIYLEFEITAADIEAPPTAEAEPSETTRVVYDGARSQFFLPGEGPLVGFTVYHNNRDLLAITLAGTVDFMTMRVTSDGDDASLVDFRLPDLFRGLRAYAGSGLPEPYCLLYQRDDVFERAIPLACETTAVLERDLNSGDVFWFDSRSNRLRDLIIRNGGATYLCPAEYNRCEF